MTPTRLRALLIAGGLLAGLVPLAPEGESLRARRRAAERSLAAARAELRQAPEAERAVRRFRALRDELERRIAIVTELKRGQPDVSAVAGTLWHGLPAGATPVVLDLQYSRFRLRVDVADGGPPPSALSAYLEALPEVMQVEVRPAEAGDPPGRLRIAGRWQAPEAGS